jgi:hypothetical protein
VKRPRVWECGRCGHQDYHCPASGCNHGDCECEEHQQITTLELSILERCAADAALDAKGYTGTGVWAGTGLKPRIVSQAIVRLEKKGCLRDEPQRTPRFVITDAGRAVLLGCPAYILRDIIGMVADGPPPSVEALAGLTRDQREEIREWASREHLRASDNIVRRLPRPALVDTLPRDTTPLLPDLVQA